MKLTDKQMDIIKKMDEGWELGFYSGYDASVNLQKGGLGKGGESKPVNYNTFSALRNRELVTPITNQNPYAFPQKYYLTDKAHEILKKGVAN